MCQRLSRAAGVNEYIMNSDVQKLLGVSSATATRILTAFTKTGKLKRIRIESHWGYMKG